MGSSEKEVRKDLFFHLHFELSTIEPGLTTNLCHRNNCLFLVLHNL